MLPMILRLDRLSVAPFHNQTYAVNKILFAETYCLTASAQELPS